MNYRVTDTSDQPIPAVSPHIQPSATITPPVSGGRAEPTVIMPPPTAQTDPPPDQLPPVKLSAHDLELPLNFRDLPDLPEHPVEPGQPLQLPANERLESLYLNDAYRGELARETGLTETAQDLGDKPLIIQAVNRDLVDSVWEIEPEHAEDTYETRRDAVSEVILGQPFSTEQQFFQGVRQHIKERQALRERRFPTWMDEQDVKDIPELGMKAMYIRMGLQYAEESSRRRHRPVAVLNDDQLEDIGRTVRRMQQSALAERDAIEKPKDVKDYLRDRVKLITGGAVDSTLATVQGLYSETAGSIHASPNPSANAINSAKHAEELQATLGQLRQAYAQVYKINSEEAERFDGVLFTTIGQAIPALTISRLGLPAAAIPLQFQGFQYSLDDAEETARRNGQAFDPNQAYKYAATMGTVNSLLNFIKADKALSPWLKTNGPNTLYKGAISALKPATVVGGVSAAQGGINDAGATVFGIEDRNVFDPEKRAMDFAIGALTTLPVSVLANGSKIAEAFSNRPKAASPINDRIRWLSDTFGGASQVRRSGDSTLESIGLTLTDHQISKLSGAPQGSTISITGDKENRSVFIVAGSDLLEELIRTIRREPDGALVLHNVSFKKNRNIDIPRGFGAFSLANQVGMARELQFYSIRALAAGSKAASKEYNGYYTWPRLGFDCKINEDIRKILPARFSLADSILDLYETDEGRLWWAENGFNQKMEFNLSPQSRSSKVLKEYFELNSYPLGNE